MERRTLLCIKKLKQLGEKRLVSFQFITVSDHNFGRLPHHRCSKLPDLRQAQHATQRATSAPRATSTGHWRLPWPGCSEEHRVSTSGDVLEYLLNLGLEAHVQHSVSLVKDLVPQMHPNHSLRPLHPYKGFQGPRELLDPSRKFSNAIDLNSEIVG